MPFCGGNSFQGRGNGNVVSCVKQKTLLFGCLTISLGSIHDPGGRDMPRSFPSFSEFPPQQQMKLQRYHQFILDRLCPKTTMYSTGEMSFVL